MKVIIAGSRSIDDLGFVREAVEASPFTVTKVVSGCAKGVDKLGEEWALENDIEIEAFPADWKNLSDPRGVIKRTGPHGSYNALAGIHRNTAMGQYADALIAVWDGKSTGTKHMIEYMQSLGKPVFVYNINNI